MPSRVIWILLLVGMLCVSMSAAQNKEQNQNTRPGGTQPPAAQTPTPAADSITELKARVDKLDAEIKDLKTSSHQSTPTDPVQALNSSLQVATWITLIIVVLILASAIWLWQASKRLSGLATADEVNAARDAATNAVNAARDMVRNDVTTARDMIQNSVNTVSQLSTDVSQMSDLLKSLKKNKNSIQGVLDELKSKIDTLPSR